ncbi:17.4 kDa class I heat shock protein-like [Vigna umbellata]|uniref:17.4 kDa class I heat shock protein-like n=1 Tax=Vigna umbellata TaxID=87088 RepID=UPI001F5F51ED|nr:17.4 kDa class I heat shock protein-like [Vigna umbellata]
MSMVPKANPFEDSPFTALSTSGLSGHGSFRSGQFMWEETAEAHVLKGEVPGLRREELKVEIENGRVLQVSGERVVETEEDSDSCRRLHRGISKFKNCFTIPPHTQPDRMMASMENGVLTITLPKLNPPIAISN